MQDLDEEAEYFLRRAHEEREQAKTAHHPNATAAHRALSERYATRAFLAQLDGDERLVSDRSHIGRPDLSNAE